MKCWKMSVLGSSWHCCRRTVAYRETQFLLEVLYSQSLVRGSYVVFRGRTKRKSLLRANIASAEFCVSVSPDRSVMKIQLQDLCFRPDVAVAKLPACSYR